MAQKKAGGSSRNGRDSAGRRLGIKINHMQKIKSGAIIIRQRGKKIYGYINTIIGKDHTIHSKIDGYVQFFTKRNIKYVQVVKNKPE